MPSYLQLQAEVWWGREYQPPTLAALCDGLRSHFAVGPEAIGSKGDNNHLYGYHRSRAWILNSGYSAYGTGDYSVQAAADRQGDSDWLCAVDINPGSVDKLIAMCQRLDAAVRAGRCPQLREWYGNVDGDQVVDGWDLLRGRAATSDSSHLWHLHLSFLRGRAGDDHSTLYAILTGDDVTPDELLNARITGTREDGSTFDFSFRDFVVGTNAAAWATLNELRAANAAAEASTKAALAKLDEVLAFLQGGVEVNAKVDLTDEAIAKVADATADELHADPERDGAGT